MIVIVMIGIRRGGVRGIIGEKEIVIETITARADIGSIVIVIVKIDMTGEIDPLRTAITLTDGAATIGEKAMGTESLGTGTVIAETATATASDPVATNKTGETTVPETEIHTAATSPTLKRQSRSASSKRKNGSAS